MQVLPSSIVETHRIQRYFPDHGVIRYHHGDRTEQHFQVIGQLLSSRIPAQFRFKLDFYLCYFILYKCQNQTYCPIRSYPGFIVINTAQVGFSVSSVPSNMNFSIWPIIASCMVLTCCAMTDNTSSSILLNSSKQAHAPDWAKPW